MQIKSGKLLPNVDDQGAIVKFVNYSRFNRDHDVSMNDKNKKEDSHNGIRLCLSVGECFGNPHSNE